MENKVFRGDIYYADLSGWQGSEQGGVRPVLIIQNNIGNRYSPTVSAAPITSQLTKARLPTHVELEAGEYGLMKDSVVLCEQSRSLDKKRLKQFVGYLNEDKMYEVNNALAIQFGLVLANRVGA